MLEFITKECSLRESTETEFHNHVKFFAEFKTKTIQEIFQLFSRVRVVEEKTEEASAEDETEHQRTISVIEGNEQLKKRVDDVEKEVNSIQEKFFMANLSPTRKQNLSSQSYAIYKATLHRTRPSIGSLPGSRGAMVTKITLVARLQKLIERLPSHGCALNHAHWILLYGRNMVWLKFVEEFRSQITSRSRPDGIKRDVGTFVKIRSIRYGL